MGADLRAGNVSAVGHRVERLCLRPLEACTQSRRPVHTADDHVVWPRTDSRISPWLSLSSRCTDFDGTDFSSKSRNSRGGKDDSTN